MNRRRVVITGMGVVSPVGNNVETAWNNVKNGVSGLGNISLFDSSRLKVHVDAEVKNFNIEDYGISSRATSKMARFSKFCLAASAQAIEDAGYTKETLQAEKTGVLLGCCIGGMDATSDAFKKLFDSEGGPDRMPPLTTPLMISNEGAANASIYYGLKGFSWT